jgi:hypothetical protein
VVRPTTIQDLARETTLWSAQLDPSVDRRTLLLKLGFALTMAAAAPDSEAVAPVSAPKTAPASLTGIWRSEYSYYSTGRAQDFTGVHYVVLDGPVTTATMVVPGANSRRSTISKMPNIIFAT